MELKQGYNFFENKKDFVKGLVKFSFSLEQILEILNHEKAHFETARELGYPAKYRIKLNENSSFRGIKGVEEIKVITYGNPKIKPLDAIKILLAPEKPSEIDCENANKYRRQLRIEKEALKKAA